MNLYFQDKYDVIEDKEILKSEQDIKDYFTTNGKKFFKCGKEFYQEKVSLICKIEDNYYEVTIKGLINLDSKGNYFVNGILDVRYTKLQNFQLPKKTTVKYVLKLTENELLDFEKYMMKKNIDFERK